MNPSIAGPWPPNAHATLRCSGGDHALVGRITRSVLADAGLTVTAIEDAVVDVRHACHDHATEHSIHCRFFERADAIKLEIRWTDSATEFYWLAGTRSK